MSSESIAHEAEGQMGYWLRGHEGERNNCFSKIQVAGQKHGDKTSLTSLGSWFSWLKLDFNPFFCQKADAFATSGL